MVIPDGPGGIVARTRVLYYSKQIWTAGCYGLAGD
jgi:hypothetical protein